MCKRVRLLSTVYHMASTFADANMETSEIDMDAVLEKEMKSSEDVPWSRLQKMQRIDKLMIFCDEHSITELFTEQQRLELRSYLRMALEQRRIHRAKDVEYDRTTGKVLSVPGLKYHTTTNKFTIKRDDTVVKSKTVRKKNPSRGTTPS